MAYEIGGRADKYGNRFELMLKSKHMCLANTDLRFHLLYIAQTKKKAGIHERENYHAGFSKGGKLS